ncbi:hypothetical protein GCM10011578_049150 [Streptomyces fuscichromogenes]|uniref:Uncharacterized protein n=1 Tax=Streptomyces fuscichromogenes TaxID=1324013 RepID=A0A917XF95_9ACTN|nr:hypothetical protein GCM10011578_049150 [Streptomyces fuscichromogenes]
MWGMSVRLPERVGRAVAREVSFTSRRVDGHGAAEIGLVDRCVADDRLDGAVAELTAEIAANSAGTNRIYKALYARQSTMDRGEALRFERSLPFGLPEDRTARLNATRR